MLLAPEGGFSYRLMAFPSEGAALDYAREHARTLQRETVALRTRHSELASRWPGRTDEEREAVVIARNPARQDAVQLYSFVEMEDARAFARELTGGGVEPELVLIYWAVSVSLREWLEDSASRPPAARPVGRPDAGGAVTLGPPAARAPVRSELRQDAAASPGAMPEAAPEAPAKPSRPPEGPSFLGRVATNINAWGGWDGLAPLMVSASLLNPQAYATLGRDRHATGRAALIVGLLAVAAGVRAAGSSVASVAWHVPTLLLGWWVYVGIVYVVGTWVLAGQPEPFRRFFQAAGLASSPGLLIAFGGVPIYGPLIVLGASIWVAISVGVAASAVLELRRESALLASAVGWCSFFAISLAAPLALS